MYKKMGLTMQELEAKDNPPLFENIVGIIEESRTRVAVTVNSAITVMYWHIGRAINEDVLKGKRAEYGKQVVQNLSAQLQEKYGTKEFSVRSLRRMMQFAERFPDFQIVSTASTQLSWSHFFEILPLKNDMQQEFYVTMAVAEHWTVRELRRNIDTALYERTLISKKPKEFIKKELSALRTENRLNPDLVFKSKYFLDFTGLKGFYSERDLEDKLLTHLQSFVLEMGKGFAFVERQKRMIIDGEDFHLDLLFFHRKLRRLVAVELKLGKFRAEYKGQMELYLRYLEKYETEEGEESPLGLLLCSEGSEEQIELLQLDNGEIKVAQYMTELPDKKRLLEEVRKQREILENEIGDAETEEN